MARWVGVIWCSSRSCSQRPHSRKSQSAAISSNDDPHDIGDDLVQIEKTIECFNTELQSRLNDRRTGPVVMIGQRVHERDLSAYLLRKKKKWKHVVLPPIATATQTYETASGKWRRHKGELLRPGAFGPEDLDELREDNINPDFEMLYQQDFAIPRRCLRSRPSIFRPLPNCRRQARLSC